MRKTSFAAAKAHLSALVDEAEHKGERILILRHGKPAAAIVPVQVAAPVRRRRVRRSERDVRAIFDALGPGDDSSAVEDLLQSRR